MAVTISRNLASDDTEDPNFQYGAGTENLNVSMNLAVYLQDWANNYQMQQAVPWSTSEKAAFSAQVTAQINSLQGYVTAFDLTIAELRAERDRLPKQQQAPYNVKIKSKQTSRKRFVERIAELETSLHPVFLIKRRKYVPDPANTLTITSESKTAGCWYWISDVKNTLKRNEAEGIASAFLDDIDDELQKYYYNASDNGAPLTGFYMFNRVEKSRTIYRKLLRMRVQAATDVINLQGQIAKQCGLLAAEGTYQDAQDWRYPTYRMDPLSKLVGLWVPKELPLIMFDQSETTGPFERINSRYQETPIRANEMGLYRFTTQGQFSVSIFLVGVPAGGGGGGDMRADLPAEVEYRWDGDIDIGKIIGLAPQSMIPGDSQFKPSPGVVAPAFAKSQPSPMDGLIRYARKFVDPLTKKKKNLPRNTFPLTPARYSKNDDQKSYGMVDSKTNFTKKRKGQWQFAVTGPVRSGEVLKGKPVAQRQDAGAVMALALAALKFPVNDGSANEFARYIVAHDPDTVTAWGELSKALAGRADVPQATVDAEKKEVRTDQEWCHLLGHGDGGNEALENFVSGSEHCNTEQLAIETAQRARKPRGLTAKITAYLLHSQTQKKNFLTKPDTLFLALLNEDVFPLSEEDPQLIDSVVKAIASIEAGDANFPAILTAGDKPRLINQTMYAALAEAKKKGFRDAILEDLKNCVYLPWPLGAVIRYKIYADEGENVPPKKIFDHFFWAQKESFDIHEFKILYWTLRKVIAVAQNTGDIFEKEVKMKASKRKDSATSTGRFSGP